MNCLKSVFYALVLFTSLHLRCCKSYFLQGPVGKPDKKENVRCLSKQIKEEEQTPYQFTEFFTVDAERTNIVERIALVGTNFTYECYGKEEAVFRWGLYEKGDWSPSILFSRVVINKTGAFCSVSWSSNFQTSRYFGRTIAEYNVSSNCLLWILSYINDEDGGTFVAVVRDDFEQGKGFRKCTTVSLKVYKATPPPPTRPPVRRTTAKTAKEKPSPTAPRPPFTTSKPSRSTPSSKKPSFTTPTQTSEKNTLLWITIVVILPFLVAIIIILVRCKRRNGELSQKINIDQEHGNTGDSKDNLLLKNT